MALSTGPLDPEDMDTIILDARSGDLESLQEIFTTIVDPSVLPLIKDSENDSTPLHMAAANGHLEVVQYIISLLPKEKVASYTNQQNSSGNTALHWAALNGKLDVVKFLCDECEADPFLQNKARHDAFFEAENNDQGDVETYFLTKFDVEPLGDDEDVNIQIKEGTEIEQVTKEATEALAEATEKLNL